MDDSEMRDVGEDDLTTTERVFQSSCFAGVKYPPMDLMRSLAKWPASPMFWPESCSPPPSCADDNAIQCWGDTVIPCAGPSMLKLYQQLADQIP